MILFFGIIVPVALLVILIWLITHPVRTGTKAIGNTKKFKGSFGPFSVDLEKELENNICTCIPGRKK